MVALYLTKSSRQIHEHQNIEQLLEAYVQELSEILSEIRNLRVTVDETNQFIDTHLSSVRNKMIEMGIFMDMGALALGVGAFGVGLYGMNLPNGFNEDLNSNAFIAVSCSSVAITVALCGG